MKASLPPIPFVDVIRTFASQLIVWHHFSLYSPFSDVTATYLPALFAWIVEYGRMAVPAFLVIGGFLTARSLLNTPESLPNLSTRKVGIMILRRYERLTRPYLIALLAAITCATIASRLLIDPDFAEPSFLQVLSHVLLLHDVVGQDALTAGAWYVAIDFQLFALFMLLGWGVQKLSKEQPAWQKPLLLGAAFAMTCGSLFYLNLHSELDMFAPYFFGAYGLGILAQWASIQRSKLWGSLTLILLTGLALWMEWRLRIAIAGVTALALVWCQHSQWLTRVSQARVFQFGGKISYAVFLMHYPVCVLISAIGFAYWPEQGAIGNLIGLFSAWTLSLLLGKLVHEKVECGPFWERTFGWLRRLQPSKA